MNTIDPFRAKPVPHRWALRVSWVVLLGSLALPMINLIRHHTARWTFSKATTEHTIAMNFWGIWFTSFQDASGRHGVYVSRSETWDESQVHSQVLMDFNFLKLMLCREMLQGNDWQGSLWSVGVPFWLLIIPAAILPIRYRRRRLRRWIAWMKLRRLRRRSLSLGHCTCGYDLRAARGRCPECGRAVRMIPTAIPLRPRRRRVARA